MAERETAPAAKPSLLDVAKSMQAPIATADSGAAVQPEPQKKLTLLDVAKDQAVIVGESHGAEAAVGKMTLVDVAHIQKASTRASVRSSLTDIAQEINKEENTRIQKALETTATEVKNETIARQISVLSEAVKEIQQEESQAANILLKKVVETKQAEQSVSNDVATPEGTPRVSTKATEKQDGYSSFEDDEPSNQSKDKNKHTKASTDVDADGKDDDEGGDAPLRTTPSDRPESKVFLRAVYRGDLRKVRDMLEKEVDANVADQHGWSGLHWAASQDHVDVLDLLIKEGSQVSAVDHMNHWSPLHIAIIREAVSSAKALLAAGADTKQRDLYGDRAVDYVGSVRGKKKSKFRELFERYQS
ncbi:TPA: hypothetical protein N0F65_002476 [Lagenidium giganteum]|uniref:Uncharacterized protein n=1 Tax=Lagenidium giganteum TaxID=4803 RepID=A0AAV2YWX8_9STRA|nr:TPA: hypothetical protein N0F65_002476 [Lagenidium giganteum]